MKGLRTSRSEGAFRSCIDQMSTRISRVTTWGVSAPGLDCGSDPSYDDSGMTCVRDPVAIVRHVKSMRMVDVHGFPRAGPYSAR